jgi:hypothetical protein
VIASRSIFSPAARQRVRRSGVFAALTLVLLLQAACGDDPVATPIATTVTANSATTLTARTGLAPVPLPSVLVRDQNGNPMSGATVTFAVTSGGGSVTGGSVATNASGIATVGNWTLGMTAGPNTLRATVGSLAPVTFTATATEFCATRTAHTFGASSSGELATTDCLQEFGQFMDLYTVTLPVASAFRFTQTSPTMDTELLLFGPDGFEVAFNDDRDSGTDSEIKALLLPGNYLLGASSFNVGATGAYTITSAVTSANVTDCEEVFIGRGVSTVQSIQSIDCDVPGGYYGDLFGIFLRAGLPVTISMTSTAVDAYLEVFGPEELSNNNRDATTTDAQITFTPSETEYYAIGARSNVVGQTGAYTLSISAAAAGAQSRLGALETFRVSPIAQRAVWGRGTGASMKPRRPE